MNKMLMLLLILFSSERIQFSSGRQIAFGKIISIQSRLNFSYINSGMFGLPLLQGHSHFGISNSVECFLRLSYLVGPELQTVSLQYCYTVKIFM